MKVLLIQLKRAGDVLVTTPIPAVIKAYNPSIQIDFLVMKPFASLLEQHPALSRIHLYDSGCPWKTWQAIRAERYDWIFDFQSSPRSAMVCLTSQATHTAGYAVPFWGKTYRHRVSRPRGSQYVVAGKVSLISLLTGPQSSLEKPSLLLTPEERAWAQEAMPSAGAVLGIIPTHRHVSRRWMSQGFAEVGRQAKASGRAVWVFWGPGEEDYIRPLLAEIPGAIAIPATTMRQMAALLERCDVVVTNDNGPMHLATAVGTPTVTLYGPTDPACWNPGGPKNRIVRATDVSCLGCNLNTCPFGHECMSHILPQTVFQAAEAFLNRTQERIRA